MFSFKFRYLFIVLLGSTLVFWQGCGGDFTSPENLIGEDSDPAQKGLLIHYTFDDIQDSTSIDSSGSELHADIVGNYTLVSGKIGNAINFDGSGYAVLNQLRNLPQKNEPRTLAMWIKTNQEIPGHIISGYGATQNCQNFQIGSGLSVGQNLSFRGVSNCDFESNYPLSSLSDDAYHHIAISYDGAEVSLYVDGERVDQFSTDLATSRDTLCIGGGVYGLDCNDLFSGSIDDFRLYNRALSVSELINLYASADPGEPTSPDPEPTPDPNPNPTPTPPEQSSALVTLSSSSGEELTDLTNLSPGDIVLDQDLSSTDYLVIKASLPGQNVASVDFLQDGEVIHTENTAPYEHRIGGKNSSPDNYIHIESGKTQSVEIRFYPMANSQGAVIESQTYNLVFNGAISTPSSPEPPASPSSRNYDDKYFNQYGSQNLSFKRFPSTKLCRQLKQDSAQYADTNKFEITVDGVKYPVINAPKFFGIQRNSGNQHSALQNAFNKVNRNFVQAQGLSGAGEPVVYFPDHQGEDVYSYDKQLKLPNSNVILCGSDVTLKSLDTHDVELYTNARNVHIVNFRLIGREDTISTWPERFIQNNREYASKVGTDIEIKSGNTSRIKCSGCRDFVVAGNYMLGGRGGLRVYNAENIYVYDNHVERTQSDAIHLVMASKNLVAANNRVVNSGDDCISLVAYNDPRQDPEGVNDSPTNALIEGNDCWGGRGRGLTVIGGFNVTHRGNHTKDNIANGILLFPSDNHSRTDVANILISENLVEDNFHTVDSLGYPYAGGIGLMGHNGNLVRDVVIYKNVVMNTLGGGHGQFRLKHPEYIRDVRFEGNRTYGDKPDFAPRVTGNGMVYENNSHSSNTNPTIDRSKYGSTLDTQMARPYPL